MCSLTFENAPVVVEGKVPLLLMSRNCWPLEGLVAPEIPEQGEHCKDMDRHKGTLRQTVGYKIKRFLKLNLLDIFLVVERFQWLRQRNSCLVLFPTSL